MNDTTETKEELLQQLIWGSQRIQIALKAARICVYEVDLVKQLYTCFENAEGIFGISGEEILKDVQVYSQLSPGEYQQAVSDYFAHPDDQPVIDKAFRAVLQGKSFTYQARMKVRNRDFIWCQISVTPIMENGVPKRMIGVITDIHHLKTENQLLEKEAYRDSFTGLYTKSHFVKIVGRILAENSDKEHALILMDLDNFKQINDTFGHHAGDDVLLSVSRNIKRLFRKSDIIGRFGGDEFMVLVRGIDNRNWLEDRLNTLVHHDDNPYNVTMSIGVSFYPKDAKNYDELLEKADDALYQSKRNKNSVTYFLAP